MCLFNVLTHVAILRPWWGKTRVPTHLAKLGEITGKTRVLYSELGEITGKTRVLPGGYVILALWAVNCLLGIYITSMTM